MRWRFETPKPERCVGGKGGTMRWRPAPWHGRDSTHRGRVADTRPPVGHGGRDPAGQGVLAGAADVVERAAHDRVSRPSGPTGCGPAPGGLGRVADSSTG